MCISLRCRTVSGTTDELNVVGGAAVAFVAFDMVNVNGAEV